jgi:selenocysteine lyase/cysteine desulfurase
MRNPIRAASIHLRVGYVLLAPIIAVALGVLVLWDFMRFAAAEHGTFAAATDLAYADRKLSSSLQVFIVLTVILPIALAFVRIVQGSWLRTPGILGVRGRVVVVAHITLSAVVSWGVFVGSYFPTIAGPIVRSSGVEFAFHNQGIPLLTVAIIEPFYRWVGLVVGSVGLGVLQWVFSDRGGDKSAIDRYFDRAQLADLRGDLYPVEGRHRANFNAGAVSPAIRAIRHRAVAMHRQYQKSPPGSLAAADFLLRAWHASRRLLADFVTSGRGEELAENVYLGESTTRILHACLAEAAPRVIIMSPFEHPSEMALEHSIGGVRVVRPTVEFLLPSNDTVDAVVDAILSHTSDGLNVVVLSEVCCYTGLRVPVRDVVQRLRRRVPGHAELAIVIDGAHAVGHVDLEFVDLADVYVFSGQKWMFAEFPAGVALVRNDAFAPRRTYDVWGPGLPVSTANQATVIDLLAAMKWRESGKGWEDLRLRANLLVEYFESRLPDSLQIIGRGLHPVGSQLRTVRPASGVWQKDDPKLALHQAGFNVEKFRFPLADGRSELWVRISFPFFLDTASIDDLATALERLAKG